MRKIFFFCTLTLFCLLQKAAPLAAQHDETEWTLEASYEFGQSMRFDLDVKSPDPIIRATLFARSPEFANTFSGTRLVNHTKSLHISQELDLNKMQLAPFTTVTYWWVLETTNGEKKSEEASLFYEDNQFEWRSVEEDEIVVYWTNDDPGLGQLALDIVAESLPDLKRVIPVDDDIVLRIYLYPSSADLRAALRLSGRDWVGAHAHPELGVILVTAVNSRTAAFDLRQSIPHELTHYLLYQATNRNYDAIPPWFSEGLATHFEAIANPTYVTLLDTAVADQTTISFSDLCTNFPSLENQALLAYAQSASMIEYLEKEYGARSLSKLIDVYADSVDCQSAIEHVYQQPLLKIEQDWLEQNKPRSPIGQLWLDNGLWVLLLLGGFVLTSLFIFNPRINDR